MDEIEKVASEVEKRYWAEKPKDFVASVHHRIAPYIVDAIRSQVKKETEELLSMVDGASVIVELWNAETPAQIEWKKNWLQRHKERYGE